MTEEPRISINGVVLTTAQAATVRVALESFASSLDKGLGDDYHGREMVNHYRAAIDDIRRIIFAKDSA
jgi:hypothetical protein